MMAVQNDQFDYAAMEHLLVACVEYVVASSATARQIRGSQQLFKAGGKEKR